MAGLLAGAIPWGSLIFAGGLSLATGLGAWYVTDAVKTDKYDQLVIADQKAQKLAVDAAVANQHVIDLQNRQADLDNAKHQQFLEDLQGHVGREITHYVKDTAPCITFGLVRVLNFAAGVGGDPDNQPAPAGQPDDACAPVPWRSFAADLSDDYFTGRKNATQLNDLQKSITNNIGVTEKKAPAPNWWDRNFGGE